MIVDLYKTDDSKYPLLWSEDIHLDDYIHIAWEQKNGEVLSFESIPGNSPKISYVLWANTDDYIDAIKDVDWIMDPDNIEKIDTDFKNKYPDIFKDELEE